VSLQEWLLIVLTGSELLLLILVVGFFARLRRSEDMLSALQGNQAELMGKLQRSAQVEQELIDSFEDRQRELYRLEDKLNSRARELSKLLKQAEEISRSLKKGQSARELAKATGLTQDEVELIISQR
jgi:uncharacterized protein HemX